MERGPPAGEPTDGPLSCLCNHKDIEGRRKIQRNKRDQKHRQKAKADEDAETEAPRNKKQKRS